MYNMTRRSLLLTGVGTLTTAAIGPCMTAQAGSTAASSLEKMKVVIPRNSVFVLNYMGAQDAGIYRKHGIDLDIDARPFAGFLAGLPSKQCFSVMYSGMAAVEKMNQGLDWAIIGGGLTVVQEIFVRKDAPFKSVVELRGKRVGTHSTGSGAFIAARIAAIDAYGFDIVKDTQLKQLAPPALYKLLEDGRLDAMITISSFTIRAASEPDKFRSIFSPNEYWKKKTDYPIVWAAPLVAWKSWVQQNPKLAKNYAAATEESFRWLRIPENFDAAVKKHGELAGVTKPAEIATYKKWLAEKKIFLAHWDKKVVDAEWKFLELAKKHGVISKVPSEKEGALLVE